jgi:hypothetical protein
VGHADELGPLVDQPGESCGVQLPVLVVGDDDDLGAGPPGDLEVGQHVAAVLGPPGQDPVTGSKRNRVEGGLPGVGGVVEQRHLPGLATHQLGEPGVGGVDRPLRGRRRLVAAELGLQPQVAGHRIQRRPGEQRGPGVVQVQAVRAPRGDGTEGVEIHARVVPAAGGGNLPGPARTAEGSR